MAKFAWSLVLVVLISGSNMVQSITSGCDRVFEYFPYCLEFLVGISYKPTKKCCDHIDKLNILAKHRVGPRWLCWCIQLMVKGTQPRLQASRIKALPPMCHTHLSFPISESMDCDKVPKVYRNLEETF